MGTPRVAQTGRIGWRGGTSGKGRRDGGGSPSAALILRALEPRWPGWGRCWGQQFPTYPLLLACRQRAAGRSRFPPPSPWRFYTLRRRRGERSALSPIPRCWVSSCDRTDVQTPPERRDVRPPLLPPRAGNGPNSVLGPAGIERAAATAAPPGLCRRGDAAVGRRMGPRGRAEGCGRMERVCRFGASCGARAPPGTFPGVRGRSHPHTHPCGDGVALKMGMWSR